MGLPGAAQPGGNSRLLSDSIGSGASKHRHGRHGVALTTAGTLGHKKSPNRGLQLTVRQNRERRAMSGDDFSDYFSTVRDWEWAASRIVHGHVRVNA